MHYLRERLLLASSWIAERAPSATSALAVGALLSLSLGCYLAWAPLGLIVPGGYVLGMLTWVRVVELKAELAARGSTDA